MISSSPYFANSYHSSSYRKIVSIGFGGLRWTLILSSLSFRLTIVTLPYVFQRCFKSLFGAVFVYIATLCLILLIYLSSTELMVQFFSAALELRYKL